MQKSRSLLSIIRGPKLSQFMTANLSAMTRTFSKLVSTLLNIELLNKNGADGREEEPRAKALSANLWLVTTINLDKKYPHLKARTFLMKPMAGIDFYFVKVFLSASLEKRKVNFSFLLVSLKRANLRSAPAAHSRPFKNESHQGGVFSC